MIKLLKQLKEIYINDLHVLRTYLRPDRDRRAIEVSWKVRPTKVDGQRFQNWFDTAVSDEQTTKQAKADLHDFLLKDVPVHGRLACCEIGFGGGRLLAQASSLYDAAYGIDIHNAFEKTREYLKKQGVHNAKLIDLEEAANLPEIDLFYSSIVIQHFQI